MKKKQAAPRVILKEEMRMMNMKITIRPEEHKDIRVLFL